MVGELKRVPQEIMDQTTSLRLSIGKTIIMQKYLVGDSRVKHSQQLRCKCRCYPVYERGGLWGTNLIGLARGQVDRKVIDDLS